MRIVPDSTITLYSGVTIDNGEQLAFSSKAKQTAYFASKVVRSAVPCTTVRKSGTLRVDIPGSVMATCNYLSFVNPSFDNKIVYARIIDYDYINNECIEISYAIDYWQTWMFDVSYDSMYIDREHLSQAEWVLAEANPYDPTIMEFKTGESLDISKDLEKLMYTVGSSTNNDGFKIGDVIASAAPLVNDAIGALVKVSEISFDDLDADTTYTTTPSQVFVNILTAIANEGLGYYKLTEATYAYLTTKYPSAGIQREATGSEWTYGGTSISPAFNNRMAVPCNIMYDPSRLQLTNLLEALTRWECVSSIAGMYAIPKNIMFLAGSAGGSSYQQSSIYAGQQTAKTHLSVTNKKLMRYPFSYMRVMTPTGDIKELHYEDFAEVQGGTDSCKMLLSLDITDIPTLIVAPYQYKMSGYSDISANNCNIFEAVYFAQFPTMPYMIDAYLTQEAAVTHEVISRRTIDGAWEMSMQHESVSKTKENVDLLGKIGSFIGIGSGIGDAYEKEASGGKPGGMTSGLGMLGAGAGAASWGYEYGYTLAGRRGQQENAEAMWHGAGSSLAGASDNAIARNLAGTRPAYACDKYIPSNGVGATNFNILSSCDILFLRVSLNSDIISKYDTYFSHYGYTSGRCGIPRVIRFTQGSNTDSEIPHWITVDGRPTTYIKTADCKVTNAMLPVASAIKSMFDSGVRMIKGDLD